MHLSLLKLLLLTLLLPWQVPAASQVSPLDQALGLKVDKMPLTEALKTIEEQSSWRFTYDPREIPVDHLVELVQPEQSLRVTMNRWLRGYSLGYRLIGKQVVIFSTAKERQAADPALARPASMLTLRGVLVDQTSQERLIGGQVAVAALRVGSYSNEHGHFSLRLPKGSHQLQYSAAGYQQDTLPLTLNSDTLIRLNLTPLTLGTVEITAADETSPVLDKQIGRITLSAQEAKQIPALGGEVDVLKVLQLMPGVQGGTDGSAGLYVRGGGPDQNLVLLDGVPIYNPTHLFGFLSNFNPDAISYMELIKGGFPARYGGRLSSVLDVQLKDGNAEHVTGSGSIGLISSNVTIEGPIGGKASFIASARYSYPDIFIGPISRFATRFQSEGLLNFDILGYRFYDLNGKLSYRPSLKDQISLSIYQGDDRGRQRNVFSYQNDSLNYRQEERSRQIFGWGNRIASLQWHHLFSSRWALHTTAYYNRSRLRNFGEQQQRFTENGVVEERNLLNRFESGIEDLALKSDVLWSANNQHEVRAGGQVIYHRFEVGTQQLVEQAAGQEDDTLLAQPLIGAWEASAYVEDTWSISSQISLRYGLHASAFQVRGQTYTSLQPRFSGHWLVNDRLAIKASYAQMVQFLHLLTNSGIGLPTDLWVPATDQVAPQRAWETGIGTAYQIRDGLDLTVEGYYKRLFDVLAYREGANFLLPEEGWESQVVSGQGWAYGLEVLLRKTQGKLTGWLGYTLSWAQRQSDQINFGEIYPYKYDRRHDVGLSLVYRWRPNVRLSGNWVFASGNVASLPIARYELRTPYFSTQGDLLHYQGRNNFRLPASHRLDLGVSFIKEKKRGTRTWNLGLYNAYNQTNPFVLSVGQAPNQSGSVRSNVLFIRGLLPLLPIISYRFDFRP
ncbi:MAG: TonB-dependent receptor plug domain-containing protein [Bacteroidota bacterium]